MRTKICLSLLISCGVLHIPTKSIATELGIREHRFTINGEPTFLIGISYYGGLGASREQIRADLDDMQRCGFNWLRVWATWSAFDRCVSAIDSHGGPRQPYLEHLRWLIKECDNRGIVVDITLHRTNDTPGEGKLPTFESHLLAVETVISAMQPYRNWYLDLANERNVRDARFVSFAELRSLRERARELAPQLLVTASDGGDFGRDELAEYLSTVQVDFIAPHRDRSRDTPKQTRDKSREYHQWMKELGRVVPLHYQEPFRRGYTPQRWEPTADDFALDLHQSIAGGAAGWCFHNGDQRDQANREPRRSFDMSHRRLFEQLDQEERKFVDNVRNIISRLQTIIETDSGGYPDNEQSPPRS